MAVVDNFKKAFKSGKSRLFLLLMVGVFVVAVGIVAYRFFGNEVSGGSGGSRISGVPSDVTSVPGVAENQNPEYLKTLLASNQEAAKRALRSGRTEVATLVPTAANAQGQDLSASPVMPLQRGSCPCCCQQCCGQQQGSSISGTDAGGAIAALEAQGKISHKLAEQLRNLQSSNVSPQDYDKELQKLVKEGKLTPAEAAKLSAAYAKAHQQSPGQLINHLLSNGAIDPSVAKSLRALNASGDTPEAYDKKLQQLVREGKLSPKQAAELEAAYKKQAESGVPSPTDVVNGLASSGAISPNTAAALKSLNAEGLTPEEYKKRLDQMVADGELTPAQAKKLLSAYAGSNSGSDDSEVTPSPNQLANQLAASGAISKNTAKALKALNAQHLSPAEYAKRLNALVKAGKLTPAQAQQLLNAYQTDHAASAKLSPNDLADKLAASGAISPNTAAALKSLNAEGLTPEEYKKRLDQMVADGKLTPGEAEQLLNAYKKQSASGGITSPDSVADQLAASGAISPDTASAVKDLNAEDLSPSNYAKRLQALVKAGKLTPQQARQLLSSYSQHYLRTHKTSPNQLVKKMLESGGVSPATAEALKKLNGEGLSSGQYAKQLRNLVAEGKLTPQQAESLLSAYHSSGAADNVSVPDNASSALQQAAAEQSQIDAQQNASSLSDQESALQSQASQEQSQASQALEQTMVSQAKALISAWNGSPQKVNGDMALSDHKKGGASGSNGGGSNAVDGQGGKIPSDLVKAPVIRSGQVLFAVLDTAVNSDQPGPIMATVVSGSFKGAKLVGSLQITPDQEAVVLSFTSMMYDGWPQSATVSAVAIDPNTARTALASNVNHHYLVRFGSLFASSFLQGIGKAIQSSGSTTVSNAGSFSQTMNSLSTGSKALVGLGQVGQSMGTEAQKEFSKPPTVTVKAGEGVGILFTADVTLPSLSQSMMVKKEVSSSGLSGASSPNAASGSVS